MIRGPTDVADTLHAIKKLTSLKFENDNSSKFFYYLTVGLVILGLIIFVTYLIQLSSEYHIIGEGSIDTEKTAQIGDFIGGLVGSLWALAGVIFLFLTLRYQTKQFEEQKKELVLQRKEQHLTRISNLISCLLYTSPSPRD